MMLSRNGLPALGQLAGLQQLLHGGSLSALREFSTTDNTFALSKVIGDKAGPGGRSSVSGAVATVFGANGFVGSYIVNELAKRGSQVVCPYRCTDNASMHLKQMGDLGQVYLVPEFNIRDEDFIRRAIARSNVVVNCVGSRLENMNYSFEHVHVEFAERLAKLSAEAGNERLIHLSDLSAAKDHKSKRMQTKAVGDELVMQNFPAATILKPGPIAGIEDHFYNYLVYQMTLSLMAPVIEGGANRIQPTYVLDVAEAVTNTLKTEDTKGKTYYLGGPEVLTMRQLYDLLVATLRMHKDDTVPVPAWAAKLMYAPTDIARKLLPNLPGMSPLACADYVEEMLRDAVVPEGALGYADLGIMPQKVTEGLAIEPVRHYRVGGYRWGDMGTLAQNVPEHIKKYYNMNK